MKLTVKKIRYIINNKKKGESSELIRKDMKISKRRVEQIWKFYSETGKEPIIGKNMGRPVKTLDPKEEEIISIAFDRYRFGARMLEKGEWDGEFKQHILKYGIKKSSMRNNYRTTQQRRNHSHSDKRLSIPLALPPPT
jgi:hypothetical protein